MKWIFCRAQYRSFWLFRSLICVCLCVSVWVVAAFWWTRPFFLFFLLLICVCRLFILFEYVLCIYNFLLFAYISGACIGEVIHIIGFKVHKLFDLYIIIESSSDKNEIFIGNKFGEGNKWQFLQSFCSMDIKSSIRGSIGWKLGRFWTEFDN